MGIRLFPHNAEAYEEVLNLFESAGKAAVVHPTGTGKSFIGFKLCEDFPKRKILWLSPSAYIFRTQLQNLKEAADGYTPANVRFCTYARLMRMDGEEMRALAPDFIVMDEFHRCGAEKWGEGVRRLLALYPQSPLLGLSATAIRYLDNQRDMAGELFEGNIASEMTLGDAIVRGVLNPPRYVSTVYAYRKALKGYEQRVRRLRSRGQREKAEQFLEAMRRTLEKADGLDAVFARHMTEKQGKYIVFCADFAHMQEMIEKAGEWFSKVDSAPRIYKVYTKDPLASEAFAAFQADKEADHLRLLYCIDALNEGVHVEGVSGVILLRPTVSPIIYKQQIGRALSAGSRSSAVIFDIVMNIDNLYSIDSVREEMRVAMTYYRSLGENRLIVNDRFDVIDEVEDCRELFRQLDDTLTASWDTLCACAEKYFREHGHLDVPKLYKTAEGYSLGSWIATQRRVYNGSQAGVLDAERIARLNRIGMIWDSRAELSWKRNYEAAQAYFHEHGDLRVPAEYESADGLRLGRWIANLRQYRKIGAHSQTLTAEHIRRLDDIGMVWDVSNQIWERNYRAARRYFEKHGNLQAPQDYIDEDGVRLGSWLGAVRRGCRSGKSLLSEEQKQMLCDVGMCWDTPFESSWETGYAKAAEYYRQNGNLRVAASYVDTDGYRLGAWIYRQRESQSKGTLSPSRKKKLDALGMQWRAEEDPWEVRFALVEEYSRANGNLRLPGRYVVDGMNLSKWLNEQKQIYRGGRPGMRLSGEQIRRLEAIGMDWRSTNETVWEERFAELKRYFDRHGNLKVPAAMLLADGKNAAAWLKTQRRNRRKGILSSAQIEKLDSLRMQWELPDAFENGVSHAAAYYAEYGDLNVPPRFVCADGYRLGEWLARQRSAYSERRLDERQAKRLEQIGMRWNSFKERERDGVRQPGKHTKEKSGSRQAASEGKSAAG